MAKKINKASMQEIAGLAVGAVAAAKVANIKLPVNLPAPLQASIPFLLGVFMFKKSGMMGSIGKGLVAAGSVKVIGALVPSLGIGAGEMDPVGDYMIEGADTYALAGAGLGNTSYALAGVDRTDKEQFG